MEGPRSVRLASSRRASPQPSSSPASGGPAPRRDQRRKDLAAPNGNRTGAVRQRSRRAPVVQPRRGILDNIAGFFGALVGAVLSLFQGRGGSRRVRSSRRYDHRNPQTLHNTFRSGSAASTSSSLRSRDGVNGLRRSTGRGSPVIGQPLSHSTVRLSGRGRGRGYSVRGRGGRRISSSRVVRRGYAPAPAPLRPMTVAVASIALAALLFVGSSIVSTIPAGMDPETETPLLDIPLLNPTDFTVSTPKSEWRAGEMPHLYQTDVKWASLPYGGSTVATNACGPTVMTMLYVYFTGNTDMDPGDMSTWADRNNYAPTGATEWAFMTDAAAAFGFYGEMVAPTRSTIEDALRSGNPVVCVVDPGDFTDVGHYIILKSIDDRAMVEVYDPNSPERSARKWDIVRVLNQTDVAWIYSNS